MRDDERVPPRLMTAITEEQGMERWIEGTPVHVLYMDRIAQAVPDALFVHVIRDGRDCALSTDRQGWAPPLPWDANRRVGVAALFWEWMVRAGRGTGRAHPRTYMEVRFEQLIDDPRAALADVGQFIDHNLDLDRIAANPVHALKNPNTSFREERTRGEFNPIGRWKSADAGRHPSLRGADRIVLEELGYKPTIRSASAGRSVLSASDASYLSRPVRSEASFESPHAAGPIHDQHTRLGGAAESRRGAGSAHPHEPPSRGWRCCAVVRGEPMIGWLNGSQVNIPATEAAAGQSLERMPIVVTGHVDHGKSTSASGACLLKRDRWPTESWKQAVARASGRGSDSSTRSCSIAQGRKA